MFTPTILHPPPMRSHEAAFSSKQQHRKSDRRHSLQTSLHSAHSYSRRFSSCFGELKFLRLLPMKPNESRRRQLARSRSDDFGECKQKHHRRHRFFALRRLLLLFLWICDALSYRSKNFRLKSHHLLHVGRQRRRSTNAHTRFQWK
jgi:hypothetical protein